MNVSDEFPSKLAKQGILQQLTCPYMLEQNDVAERTNHSLMLIRASLRDSAQIFDVSFVG